MTKCDIEMFIMSPANPFIFGGQSSQSWGHKNSAVVGFCILVSTGFIYLNSASWQTDVGIVWSIVKCFRR